MFILSLLSKKASKPVLAGIHVLVIDNNEEYSKIVVALKDSGAIVHHALNAGEAKDMVVTLQLIEGPHVILINSIYTASLSRWRDDIPRIPVIILSDVPWYSTSAHLQRNLQESKLQGFIAKPILKDDLLSTIKISMQQMSNK